MSKADDATSSESTSSDRSSSDRADAARDSLSDESKDSLSSQSSTPANTDREPTANERAAGQERMAAIGQAAGERIARDLKQAETVAQNPTVADPDAAEIAQDFIQSNTSTRNNRGGQAPTHTLDMQGVAADVVGLSRQSPELAAEVYNELSARVAPDELRAAVDLELQQEHLADAALLGDATPEYVDPELAQTTAQELLDGATQTYGTRSGATRSVLDVNELAYDIEALAEENPSLAVAVRDQLAQELTPSQVSDMNRMISGNATWQENVELAVSHPVQGVIGAAKGIVNGFSALGEMFVRGSTMQAAGQQYQAAGYSAMFGLDEQAEAQMEMGEALHDAALNTDFVPELPIDNRAQAGGEILGMAIDIAMAGKGIITGGARVLARNADELAGIGVRGVDDLAAGGRLTAGGGLDPDVIDEILSLPPGARPDPSTYMSQAQIDAHLARFDDGAARLTWQSSVDRYGTPGGPGGFAMPVDELDDLISTARARFDTVEDRAAYISERLALGDGPIDLDDARIAIVEPGEQLADRVRMPTGNEAGANENWMPGGYTAEGVAEATITDYNGLDFELVSLRELLE